jgi:hypothetical protein
MVSYAAEIRRRVASFGGTLEDRLKLRIKFVENGEITESKTPASSVNYSDLMED